MRPAAQHHRHPGPRPGRRGRRRRHRRPGRGVGLHRHRGRQHLAGQPRRRQGRAGRRHRRPPARPRDRPRRPAAGLRRPPRAAPRRHPHRRGRDGRPTPSTASGWCSATTRRSPATARCGSPTPPPSSASSEWKDDFVQDTRTGRLLRRDADGTVEVVLDGLAFANGVALAADESYVAVAETAARTVVRHWLTGPEAGSATSWRSDLPGYPDNIARGSDGLIWVTHRRARATRWSSGSRRRPMLGPRGGDQDPRAAAAQAEAHRPRPGLRRRRGARARHRPAAATTTTWSPASGSTTAGSGWAACTSPRCAVVRSLCDSGGARGRTRETRSSAWVDCSTSITRDRATCAALDDDQLDDAGHRDPRLPGRALCAAPAATSAPTSAWSS